MDTFEKSLLQLQQYLNESTVEEREKVWAEVKALKIKGPSLREYLTSIQEQMEGFNDSFSQSSITAVTSEGFKWYIDELTSIEGFSWGEFTGTALAAGESDYSMAA
jgi:hypothetical protein